MLDDGALTPCAEVFSGQAAFPVTRLPGGVSGAETGELHLGDGRGPGDGEWRKPARPQGEHPSPSVVGSGPSAGKGGGGAGPPVKRWFKM